MCDVIMQHRIRELSYVETRVFHIRSVTWIGTFIHEHCYRYAGNECHANIQTWPDFMFARLAVHVIWDTHVWKCQYVILCTFTLQCPMNFRALFHIRILPHGIIHWSVATLIILPHVAEHSCEQTRRIAGNIIHFELLVTRGYLFTVSFFEEGQYLYSEWRWLHFRNSFCNEEHQSHCFEWE